VLEDSAVRELVDRLDAEVRVDSVKSGLSTAAFATAAASSLRRLTPSFV